MTHIGRRYPTAARFFVTRRAKSGTIGVKGGGRMDDGEILELFRARNTDAIAESQKKYGSRCHTLAQNLLGSAQDAEEAVNDALNAAWDAIPPASPRSLGAFLGKITRNLALKRLRDANAKKRGGGILPAPLEELEACVPGGARVEEAVEARELSQAVNAFLDALPRDDRRVFLRRYWYFDEVKVIAARFGFSESKVKMILKRRRDQLAAQLKKEGYIV